MKNYIESKIIHMCINVPTFGRKPHLSFQKSRNLATASFFVSSVPGTADFRKTDVAYGQKLVR